MVYDFQNFTKADSEHAVNMYNYHRSNSHKRMGVNGEALQLHAVCKKTYFILQVTRELYQVLQVMCAASEHAMKYLKGTIDCGYLF